MISNEFTYWLVEKSFGTIGANIFDNFQPVDPDNCITVFDVSAPNLSESSSLAVDLLGLQIIVRNAVSLTCKEIISDIHKNFMGFSGKLKSDSNDRVSMVFIDQPPFCLGKDNKNRTEWTVTYNVRFETANNAYRL